MDLGFCFGILLWEPAKTAFCRKAGQHPCLKQHKSWKGGFNMKKTYQEPVTEIVKLDIVDTTFATWASGAHNDPNWQNTGAGRS